MGRLALLGGDERQIFMAQSFECAGCSVAVWGVRENDAKNGWRETVDGADAIILPLPASSDGVRIRCPALADGGVRFSSLLDVLRPGVRILGGKIPAIWAEQAAQKGIFTEDYFNSELLQLRNALPTAEGAILLAMQALPVTLDGTAAVVTGYGRIGALLAEKLHALGANVTVYARKPRDLAHASLRHLRAVSLTGAGADSSLCRISSDCRIIFNTVPERIFTDAVLQRLPKGCILMELASPPGGFDPVGAEQNGLRCILGSALPGKCFPESAGRILAQTVSELLSVPTHTPDTI